MCEFWATAPRLAALAAALARQGRLKREDECWVGSVSGACTEPRMVTLRALLRPDLLGAGVRPDNAGGWSTSLTLWVPCRRCEACRRYRARVIRRRIRSEIRSSERTWFVTLTYRDDAAAKLGEGPAGEASAYRDVQLALKRLRKAAGDARLRFIAVPERTKAGRLHWHLLIHGPATLVRRIVRRLHWPHGFVDARLCDAGAAWYLSKYVSKGTGRIRCSRSYGLQPAVSTPAAVGRLEPTLSAVAETTTPPPNTEGPAAACGSFPSWREWLREVTALVGADPVEVAHGLYPAEFAHERAGDGEAAFWAAWLGLSPHLVASAVAAYGEAVAAAAWGGDYSDREAETARRASDARFVLAGGEPGPAEEW